MPSTEALFDAHERLIELDDGSCPGIQTSGAGDTWSSVFYADCTTATGWSIAGEGLASIELPDGVERHQYIASFEVLGPEGQEWVFGGESHTLFHADGVVEYTTNGAWHQDDAEGWLSEVEGVVLSAYKSVDELTTRGGYDLGGSAVDFDLTWASGCAGPVGSAAIRDPDGYWYEFVFRDDCSGCADAIWRSVELGESCLDLSEPTP